MTGTPTITVDSTGLHVPSFDEIQGWAVQQFQQIYGADVNVANDTQDGQLVGLLATAVNDCNAMAASAYNAFSPATAQGVGLSSVVKINGIAREVPTNSQVDLLIVGTVGVTIVNGVVGDTLGNRWDLPNRVTIPISGSITVTATCETLGAVSADPNTVNQILTPTRGWISANNSSAATPGQPVETDPALRSRQSVSTALPSRTVLDGTKGAIASISGVTQWKVYENDTDSTDGNGVPAHSIAAVVQGGDAQTIANDIFTKKGPGCGTYGTTSETVTDAYGIPRTVSFSRPTERTIDAVVNIKALNGYTSIVGNEIQAAVAGAINALGIGNDVLYTRLYVPANLAGPTAAPANPTDPTTYEVLSVLICAHGGTPVAADVAIGPFQLAVCTTDNITINVS